MGISHSLTAATGGPVESSNNESSWGTFESTAGKAGGQSTKAMKKAGAAVKAGSGAETGFETGGEAAETAVDRAGKALAAARRSTAMAIGRARSAVAGLFDGEDRPSSGEARAERVRQLQVAPKERGCYDAEIDGIPAPKTRAGLSKHQSENGLEATDRLSAESAKKLGI